MAGVSFLHTNGVMHRDLKTANVLLDFEMEPKIIDFSLAKVMPLIEAALAAPMPEDGKKKKQKKKERRKRGQGAADLAAAQNTGRCGTPAFMPPEVFLEATYDMKADIWSAGVCLLSLFHEKFHDELVEIGRERDAHAKIAETRGKLSPEKPIPLLLRHVLEVDPANRPTARDALTNICGIMVGGMELPPPEPRIPFLANLGEASSSTKSKKKVKERSWFGFSNEEKEIKHWFDLFELRSPMTRHAAHVYWQRCAATGDRVPLLSCLILAARLFEVEINEPLDDLEYMEDWADEMEIGDAAIWEFDVDVYKKVERHILRTIGYCLYVPPPL
eukprot:NODE_10536_length_1345_cov_3.642857.p1 GENE.NODE_10536_length_1345_cov_3.642857~~NODE_10536_length_1345_cov_3.642857.p1  ORF type:complete len:356 (+),score=129.91 NODE_10536_length_1345_cov_3.642857:76-1068(+)